MSHLATADQVTSIDEARLKRELKARFADIKALLGRHVPSTYEGSASGSKAARGSFLLIADLFTFALWENAPVQLLPMFCFIFFTSSRTLCEH